VILEYHDTKIPFLSYYLLSVCIHFQTAAIKYFLDIMMPSSPTDERIDC